MNDLVVTESTWIISDTHFGHANIIKYCDRPRNHNTLMLRSWKKLVKKNDTILHLGDVTVWYDTHAIWAKEVKKLPGTKFLIMGNHDEQWTESEWYSKAGMQVIDPFQQNKIFFSHERMNFDEMDWSVEANIHGHSHNHEPFRAYMQYGFTYYNVSIEGMKYKPVRMGTILKELISV